MNISCVVYCNYCVPQHLAPFYPYLRLQVKPAQFGRIDRASSHLLTPAKSKSHYDRQSVGQSVLVSGAQLGPRDQFFILLEIFF
jgi:hypothetical protein